MIKRLPDLVIGPANDPYLYRWFLIPKNKFFNIYLHKFCRSDDDRALHDHPWLFNASILLNGEYYEEKPASKDWPADLSRKKLKRRRFLPYIRLGKAPHRVELIKFITDAPGRKDKYGSREWPIYTIFITGPRVREWGFYCPKGWRLWTDYVKNSPGKSDIGRGCE